MGLCPVHTIDSQQATSNTIVLPLDLQPWLPALLNSSVLWRDSPSNLSRVNHLWLDVPQQARAGGASACAAADFYCDAAGTRQTLNAEVSLLGGPAVIRAKGTIVVPACTPMREVQPNAELSDEVGGGGCSLAAGRLGLHS